MQGTENIVHKPHPLLMLHMYIREGAATARNCSSVQIEHTVYRAEAGINVS